MNEKLEVALTALADALGELPTKDIVFELLNGGRLVDEVALMLEDRHPAKAAEMNAAFQDWKDRARRSRKPSASS
jgi:hypothetical protein